MLAAGIGARLGPSIDAAGHPPKILLEFGGRTLLERHVAILRSLGIEGLDLVVGYRADDIAAAVAACGANGYVRRFHNPDYRQGSVVSLAVAAEALAGGADVLLMDADVLYDSRLLGRLVRTTHSNAFLMDRDIEPGEEPVKLCIRDGQIVDFRKRVETPHDFHGESVGFFRLSPAVADAVAAAARSYRADGRGTEMYEEAIRDVLLGSPAGTFGYEDVTGLPWIEIDFAEDVRRASAEVLPQLEEVEGE